MRLPSRLDVELDLRMPFGNALQQRLELRLLVACEQCQNAAGLGQDYGLASAISILIFFIVGSISAISFTRTKALENLG